MISPVPYHQLEWLVQAIYEKGEDGERNRHSQLGAGSPHHRSLDAGEPVAQGTRRQGREHVAGGCDDARQALREQARARRSLRQDADHRGG